MSLSRVILAIGEFMARAFKARGHNSQLDKLRVHLSPSDRPDSHDPAQEKELVGLLTTIIQLGRRRGRKEKSEERDNAA